MSTVGWLARHRAWGVVAVSLLMSSACSGGSTTTSPSTTAPAAAVTTEVFAGTVPVNGSDIHNFNVTLSNGQINVILTAAGPPSTIFMGLGVGTPNADGTCTLFAGAAVTTQAGAQAQLSGTAQAGSYCVGLYDVGNQTADITYSITVMHY